MTLNRVYIAHSPRQGLFKIGKSNNPCRRIRNLATACPDYYLVNTYHGGEPLEKYLHKVFAAYRVDGELFSLPDDWPRRIEHAVSCFKQGLPPSKAVGAASDNFSRAFDTSGYWYLTTNHPPMVSESQEDDLGQADEAECGSQGSERPEAGLRG